MQLCKTGESGNILPQPPCRLQIPRVFVGIIITELRAEYKVMRDHLLS